MRYPWRVFWVLFVAGLAGPAGMMPFVLEMTGPILEKLPPSPSPLSVLLVFGLGQHALTLVVALGFGLLLAAKIGRGAPILGAWVAGRGDGPPWRPIVRTSILCGVAVGLVSLASFLIFSPRFPDLPLGTQARMALWKRFLACFYGGFFEEIVTHLFILSLAAWLLGKIWRGPDGLPSIPVFWAANLLVAVLIGIGYLPAALIVMTNTPLVVAAALVLNGIAALLFGYLYWTRGLEAAMLGHLSANVVVLVVGPAIVRT